MGFLLPPILLCFILNILSLYIGVSNSISDNCLSKQYNNNANIWLQEGFQNK